MLIPVHVISLGRSDKRRVLMQRQLDNLGIPFRFFDAIDGRLMSAEALATAAPKGGLEYCGLLTQGEIGAALSHLAVIRQIAEGEHEYAAVIEDDVTLMPEGRTFFDERWLRSGPAFGILQLGSGAKKPRLVLRVGSIEGHELRASPNCRFNMSALIYSRDAARLIAESIAVITAPIDNLIFNNRLPFGLRVVALHPSVVRSSDDVPSDIGHRPRPTRLLGKAQRELRRLRNWMRLWCSFIGAWGLSGMLRLRAP